MTSPLIPNTAIPQSIYSRPTFGINYGQHPIFDFENGKFMVNDDGTFVVRNDKSGFINLVRKALVTWRYQYAIYNHAYGCQIYDLIGRRVTEDELKSEVQRMVEDALNYDPRILRVYDFEITVDGDTLTVVFNYDDVWGSTQKLEIKY